MCVWKRQTAHLKNMVPGSLQLNIESVYLLCLGTLTSLLKECVLMLEMLADWSTDYSKSIDSSADICYSGIS